MMLGLHQDTYARFLYFGILVAFFCGRVCSAAERAAVPPSAETKHLLTEETTSPEPPKLPDPKSAKKVPGRDRVWIDAKRNLVMIDGYVSFREGFLEMFACPAGTKEHESVVAVLSRAQTAHAALLAVGAKPGHPVKFQPNYEPPTGTEIEIEVRWLNGQGQWKSCRAQQWVRNAQTGKLMTSPWVFAGSGFRKDEASGKEYYLAEWGDFICVSNFSTATLDIPVESSQGNEGLLFEANTEKIPPLGTPVRLVLKPKLEKKEKQKVPQDSGQKVDRGILLFPRAFSHYFSRTRYFSRMSKQNSSSWSRR